MKVRVIRDVSAEDAHNYSGRDVRGGEELFVYRGPTYGCVDTINGISLSASGPYDTPFFEFPLDAVVEIDSGVVADGSLS